MYQLKDRPSQMAIHPARSREVFLVLMTITNMTNRPQIFSEVQIYSVRVLS